MELKKIVHRIPEILMYTRYVHDMERPIEPKTILLESKHGEDLGGNIERLLRELAGEDYADFRLYLAVKNDIRESVRARLGDCAERISFVKQYGGAYFRLLATAEYLVTDTSFPRKFIKREGQIYLNTWHGTPLKRMGKDIPAEVYSMGNIQRNFMMADYLLYPSAYMKERMEAAYDLTNLYRGTYLYGGYPRNQVFFRDDLREGMREESGLSDKKVYCYMPTWRGGNAQNPDGREQVRLLKSYLDELDELLGEDEVLFLRLHPFVGQQISCDSYRHIRPFPAEYEPYEVLNMADCLVTDYSSVMFDYANRRDARIILFLYDHDGYRDERDLYMQPEELPFPIVTGVEELAKELRGGKIPALGEFRKTYCPYERPDAAVQLCRYVFRGEEQPDIRPERRRDDGKKKLLIYVGGLERIGITVALMNLLGHLDLEQYHYYATFQELYQRDDPSRVNIIPKKVGIVPITPGLDRTILETAACILYYKLNRDWAFARKYMQRFYGREYKRNFGWTDFDWYIHYSGYERKVIGIFQEAPSARMIFVHNDMQREIQLKGNQHWLTLRDAYRNYDVTAAVSDDIYERIREAWPEVRRLAAVYNYHDYKGVLKRAGEPVALDDFTICTVSREELVRRLSDENTRKIITIGRYSPEKQHGLLLEAFAEYAAECPDSLLIIIGGKGELYEQTCQKAVSLGIGEKVILIKYLSNPMPILKACDLFVLSSAYEGLGLVILEADTLGIPVVSTDVVGPRCFMKKYGGYLVSPDKEGVLAGMRAFDRGEVPVMGVDYEAYNREAIESFLSIISD